MSTRLFIPGCVLSDNVCVREKVERMSTTICKRSHFNKNEPLQVNYNFWQMFVFTDSVGDTDKEGKKKQQKNIYTYLTSLLTFSMTYQEVQWQFQTSIRKDL